jgi:hypothetical protein
MGLQVWEESVTRPSDPAWRKHERLVHALWASPDGTISIIRTVEVHDPLV